MPRKGTGLRVEIRPDTGALTIVGTVGGERIRKRAQSDSFRDAQEEAAALTTELLRTQWHGPRRGTRPFAAAVTSYVETDQRSQNTLGRLRRLVEHAGEIKLKDIDQQTVNWLAKKLLAPEASPATRERSIIVPLRAVMRHAADLGWCDVPRFKTPKRVEGRTLFLLPDQASALCAAANPALRVLIESIIGFGPRMSEILELEWSDVDLRGGRAILWKTKTGKRRNADLPPGIVAMLANLPHRNGKVIRRPDGQPYADKGREEGGQCKTAWRTAKRRAGIDPALTLHDLRHTWASWHYAVHRDPVKLKLEGGWSSLDQVERYVHLMPAGHEAAIRQFWHGIDTAPHRGAIWLS